MKNTIAYEIIYAVTDNTNIISSDNFEIETTKDKKKNIIDNNKYQVIFDLQNSVSCETVYDINDKEKHLDRLDVHESNYVALMKDDKSIIQIHGKKDRAIIEIRKHLYDALECEKVKIFRECEKNIYKNVKRDYQLVVRDVDTAVKLISQFVDRLEKKTNGKTSASETTSASEKSA